jgi:DNA-binding NtrC family response regulator
MVGRFRHKIRRELSLQFVFRVERCKGRGEFYMDINDSENQNLERAQAAARTRVLVADDDPQMQLAVKTCLIRKDYDVTVVNNGAAALDLLDKESFDLLITDQQMPQMSGTELLSTLQKRGSEMPVVMITAYGTITQAVEAMQNGAADFITKPFSASDLERIVERVLLPESKASRQKVSSRKIL